MIPEWNEPLLGVIGRWGIMLLALFILFVLSAVPFDIAHLGGIRPMFMLMAVYYLAIIRPSLQPPPAVFAIGLVLDLISAYPLGTNALILVVAQWVAGGQHKFLSRQPFPVIWAGFALVAASTGIVQWALFSLFHMEAVPAKSAAASVILSALLFPVIALLLSVMNKALAGESSSV